MLTQESIVYALHFVNLAIIISIVFYLSIYILQAIWISSQELYAEAAPDGGRWSYSARQRSGLMTEPIDYFDFL